MKEKKKSTVITCPAGNRRFSFGVIIIIVTGFTIWCLLREWGLRQSDAWKDAHPTQEQVNTWLIKDFNPDGFKIWNKNPKLEGPEFGIGITTSGQKYWKTIWDQEYYITPFGEDDWGMRCFSWKYFEDENAVKTFPIKMCDLLNCPEDNSVFVFVYHYNYKKYNRNYNQYGEYVVGTIFQGWAHDSAPFWTTHRPPPLETANKKIVLSFDMEIGKTDFDQNNPDAWQFIGVNLWFKSPDLSKRIVMDLMIYTNGKILHTENVNRVYRYQKVITRDPKEALKKWRHYDIDVSWFIDDTLKRFEIEHAAPTLKLHSLEILSEVMFGECGFWVKNVYLYYK